MRNTVRLVLAAVLTVAFPATVLAEGGDDGHHVVKQDVFCLAQNIYHEARGEPMEGKLAVGHVVMNRVADKRFPRLACSVIKQGGEKRRYRCQFSWWCDGRSDRARNEVAWQESLVIAYLIRAGVTADPTGGSLWYHATYVQPVWAGQLNRFVQIGRHIFYTDPDATDPAKTPTQVADAGS